MELNKLQICKVDIEKDNLENIDSSVYGHESLSHPTVLFEIGILGSNLCSFEFCRNTTEVNEYSTDTMHRVFMKKRHRQKCVHSQLLQFIIFWYLRNCRSHLLRWRFRFDAKWSWRNTASLSNRKRKFTRHQ